MEICQVIGNLVSTIKHPVYEGCRLLLVDTLDLDFNRTGNITVAVDSIDAGEGDVVLVAREGRAAGDIMRKKQIPLRSVIVGFIDRVDIPRQKKSKGAGRKKIRK